MQDCPPPLIPCIVERVTDGYWTDSSGVCLYPTREIISTYEDNRFNISYDFEIRGQVSMTNVSDVPRTIRYHLEIPGVLTPYWLDVVDSMGICAEDDGTLVVRFEEVINPSETVVVDFDYYIQYNDPSNGSDFNGDYAVDASDLALLLAGWGAVDSSNVMYDLNGDGTVNGADQGILFMNWTDSND